MSAILPSRPDSRSPGALAALENARIAVEQDPVRLRIESRERLESLVILRALRLGPTLEVGEAILRGERVPLSRLDPYWARAYGLA